MELLTNLRHIAEEIRPLTDAVDSLTTLLQHVWQNREELRQLVERQSEETIFCTGCDTPSPPSLAEALRAGWTCLIDDEGNERGNYAGHCPDCTRAEVHRQQEVSEQSEETAYCCPQPKLVWAGDPDAPSIFCEACSFVVAECGQITCSSPNGDERAEREPRDPQKKLF